GRDRQHHRFKLNRGIVFGQIDGVTDRLFGLREVDDRPALHATGFGMADAQDFDGMAAPPQHLLRRLRLEPRDDANDLAGADIESRHNRRAAGRHRSHFRSQAILKGHAAPPFLRAFLSLLSASWRAAEASSESRTVTRSGRRRSTTVMSRLSNLLLRSSVTNVDSACSTSVSGSRTSMPFLSTTFHRRSATSTAARICSRTSGYRSRIDINSFALAAAPTPTTSGSLAKCG